MKKIFFPILFTIYFLIFTPFASANESALSLSPAIYEAVIDRGGNVQTEVLLTNLTNFPLPIKGRATAFLPSEPLSASELANYDASSWFSLEPSDFILQPGERKTIKLNIKAGRNVEPGGHYASVFWQPLIPEGIISTPTSLARVGLLALLIVPGNLNENVQIQGLTLPLWQAFGPVNFSLTLNNSGNIHSSVKGKIVVTDIMGHERQSIELAPTTVLPGTDKTLNFTWEYRLGLGKYTFTPQLSYGPENKFISTTPASLWIIPWPLILILIMLLTIIYKIFILNASRLKLAWRALRGNLQEKDLIHDQVTTQQKNFKKNSLRRHQSHSSNHSS